MPRSLLHDFIWQHRFDDPHRLALSVKKHPEFPMAEVAAQVQALQKIRTKIPSWYRQGMEFPIAISLEQASSEATARFKADLFTGEKIADLTGGLGVDAFFFARQFESLTYVEQNVALLAAVRHNFSSLGSNNVQFENLPAEDFLSQTKDSFDLIYLDPARRDGQGGRVTQLSDCSPNVLNIKKTMLEISPRVLLKTAPMLDLKLAATQLEQVTKIWVLALEGDCREVLYLLEREGKTENTIPIEAVDLTENKRFSFSWEEEQNAEILFSAPQKYLYEPNPALLKAGAFKSFARQFGLAKFHINTHLYTSNTWQSAIPARGFEILDVCKYDRKTVQSAVPGGKANISCRNFPERPEELRKKLGLKEGGSVYLFAATDWENKKIILVCRKL